MRTRLLTIAILACFATTFAHAQNSATAGGATQVHSAPGSPAPWTSWKKVPIPPLPAFHPQQPTRITLNNGMTIFLQEDHELPFINGFVIIRGGTRSEPAAKTGLVDLYAAAWRTSGTAKTPGDQMDDLLAAKAASIETDDDAGSTTLTWSSFSKDFDTVFGMASDLLLHPQFSEDNLVLAKRQEDTGIIRRNDDPDRRSHWPI
jgi:zinc protease